MKLIDKDKVVEEIEKRLKQNIPTNEGALAEDMDILSFLDTLEMKEIVDYEEPDLTPIFEEMGVEPDSKIATAFRNAFYKGVDNFCKRKEL